MSNGDSYINARFDQIVNPQIRPHACRILLTYLDVAGAGNPVSDKAMGLVFLNVWTDEEVYEERIAAIENEARVAGVEPWAWHRHDGPSVAPPAA